MLVRIIRPARCPGGTRVFRLLSQLLISAVAFGMAAQDAPLALRTVVAEGGEMLALPEVASASVGSLGGMAVEVVTEGGVRTWRVSYGGRTYTTHAAEGSKPTRRVFDPASRRFRVVEPVLRVDVDEPERLSALVREVDAASAKAYPGLGFALIRLAPGSDPIVARERLASGQSGVSASLQLRAPIRRPMYAPPPGGIPGEPTVGGLVANSKTDLKADLLVFFNGTRLVSEDNVDAEVAVYNWGAADSEAGTLHIQLASDPDFDEVIVERSSSVPALGAKGSYSVTVPLRIAGLAPNAVYYLLAYMEEQDSEIAGRAFTNYDYSGFRLDAAGRVQVRCREPGRGGLPGVDDPLRAEQWHLANRGQTAWAANGGRRNEDLRLGTLVGSRIDGSGVRVAVVDTGLETCHPDLAAAVEVGASFNFNVGTSPADWNPALTDDPFNVYPTGDHGTSVAGLIAAEAMNGIGGRGVSPGALLRGYNFLSALDYDIGIFLDALGGSTFAPDSSDVDIFNMSFGSIGWAGNAGPEEEGLFGWGVRRLRGGLGAIYVKSAGNGFGSCRSLRYDLNDAIGCLGANADDTNNLPYVIVVGGLNAQGRRASYASVGANLWVSSPAGEFGVTHPAMVTTDQMGDAAGYGVFFGDNLASQTEVNPHRDYTSLFNGTSSAAPNLAGVIAILLDAEPELTWRDVKHLLASTARRVDAGARDRDETFRGQTRTVQHGWIRNGAGYRFHNWYGFGGVHARQALSAARRHMPGSLGEFRQSGWFAGGGGRIPDNRGRGVTTTLDVAGLPAGANIEATVVEVELDHPFPHDLGIELLSPEGTPSILNPVFNEVLAIDREGAPLRWRLLSNAFYGEAPTGEGSLTVIDGATGDAGTLVGWNLRFFYGDHPDG